MWSEQFLVAKTCDWCLQLFASRWRAWISRRQCPSQLVLPGQSKKICVYSIQMHQHWIFLWFPFIFRTWSSSPRVSRAPSRTVSSPWETDSIRRTDWDRATSRKCTLRSLAVYGSDEFVRILFRQDEKATVPKIGQALGWQQILKVQYSRRFATATARTASFVTANDVGHWDQKHPKVLIVGKKHAKNLIAMYSGPTQFKK